MVSEGGREREGEWERGRLLKVTWNERKKIWYGQPWDQTNKQTNKDKKQMQHFLINVVFLIKKSNNNGLAEVF